MGNVYDVIRTDLSVLSSSSSGKQDARGQWRKKHGPILQASVYTIMRDIN